MDQADVAAVRVPPADTEIEVGAVPQVDAGVQAERDAALPPRL